MILITKDFEQHLLAHHSGHVHPEPGTTTTSGSSRRRLQSASRHFSFRQPCLSASVPPVCSYWDVGVMEKQVLVDGGCWSLILAELGRLSIGRPRIGGVRSVGQLLLGVQLDQVACSSTT